MDPITAAVVTAGISAGVGLIETCIKLAAAAGFDEAACEAMKQDALKKIGLLESNIIAQEAKEERIKRGEIG